MTGKKRSVNDTRDLSEVLAAFCQIARASGEAEEPAVTTEAEAEHQTDRVLLLPLLPSDTRP